MWPVLLPLNSLALFNPRSLADAGYADGVEVDLSTSDIGGPRVNDAAIAIQEMVKVAGFTITIDKVPVGDFWSPKYMQAPFFAS